MSASCALCGTDLQIDSPEAVVDHLRVEHPDQYQEPARWPDGELVVYDETLTPGDFMEETK